MTLEQLAIFIAVAEREHLTRAAETLRLTPSAVSSAIRNLEDRYGAVLFDRVGRRIELTEAGRLFLPQAKMALGGARAAEQALVELGGLARGHVSVHASQTIASYWVPPILARYHDAYPGVQIRLHIGNTADTARAVLSGEADIGFAEGVIDHGALSVREVGRDQLVVVMPRAHRWADGRDLSDDEIRACRWIMREPGSGTRAAFESALAARGVDPTLLDVALALPSNEAVRAAVLAGEFVAVMSEVVAAADLDTGRLVKAGLKLPPRAFSMVRHKERYRTKASLALEALIPFEAKPGSPSRRG